jgi:hypothetical protein
VQVNDPAIRNQWTGVVGAFYDWKNPGNTAAVATGCCDEAM